MLSIYTQSPISWSMAPVIELLYGTESHDMNMIFPKAFIFSIHTTLYDMNN